MNIKLPSNGHFGVVSVNMRQPRVNDLRMIPELSSYEPLAKYQFVKALLEKPEVLDSISIFDKEYLFAIAVGVINLNKIGFTFTAPAGNLKGEFDLSSKDVTELLKSDDLKVSKEVSGELYNFHLPTVQEELKIIDYASSLEDVEFDEGYQDGLVMTIFGKEPNSENQEWLDNLDITVYYAAIYYYQCCFHGVETTEEVTCPECGTKTNVVVPLTKSLLSIDTMTIMSRFTELSGSMDFQSFSNLTIPELSAVTKALETKNG